MILLSGMERIMTRFGGINTEERQLLSRRTLGRGSINSSFISSSSHSSNPQANPQIPRTNMTEATAATSSTRKVWFITGASSGLGYSLTLEILSRGDKVIATARDVSKLDFLKKSGAHTMQLDVTDDFPVIRRKAKEAIEVYGHVDVIVNNAGYGMFGALEEVGAEGYMAQYKTNVFGVINVTHAFLPHMRQRRSGSVLIVGSRSAWTAKAALVGPYSSSKAAVHAIAESLVEELKPFNIKVLLIQPGAFRTGMILNTKLKAPTALQNPDYTQLHTVGCKVLSRVHGKQPGDPRKAGRVIVDIVKGEGSAIGRKCPDTIILGEDAMKDIRKKCESVVELLDDTEWRDVMVNVRL